MRKRKTRLLLARDRQALAGHQYAAAFAGNNNCHGVLDHPLSRMMTIVDMHVRRITKAITKILAFALVGVHGPS
jgi:hypothetical protein